MRSFGTWIFLAATTWLPSAYAQDMMNHVDLSSPKFSSAEMTRAEIETIVLSDPFSREKIARYEIVEFLPSMADTHFAQLKAP